MKTVKFDKLGEPLKVKFDFIGLIAGSYSYKLWDKDLNNYEGPIKKEGLIPCSYDLKSPNEQNDGRVIELYTYFKGNDMDNIPDYTISADILQGEVSLGGDTDSKKVTGDFQESKIRIKLIEEGDC